MSIKVLIADDNEMFRRLIARYLQKHPEVAVVGEATDGGDAIRKATELRPDIVLLDIDMPNQDGQTACIQIKHSVPAAKVYLCSAHSDTVLGQIAGSTPADGIVRKSALSEDLGKIIGEASRKDEVRGTKGGVQASNRP
ncbi:MAG TPA: response regulator transcription factor [Bacteroidota bacterium]